MKSLLPEEEVDEVVMEVVFVLVVALSVGTTITAGTMTAEKVVAMDVNVVTVVFADVKTLTERWFKTCKKEEISLSQYAGKVLLIVNVASKCGYTKQYTGLEKLHEDLSSKGLVILGAPCNQFGGQEPGSNQEIQEFCERTYNVKFPLLDKLDVNGPKTAPLYVYLKEAAKSGDISWNFEKFLVNKEGKVVKHYKSGSTPESIKPDIEALL